MKHKISLKLGNLRKISILLNELNLMPVLLGKKIDIEPMELYTKLINQGKIIEFLNLSADLSREEIEELSLKEIGEIISDFFSSMQEAVTEFAGSLKIQRK